MGNGTDDHSRIERIDVNVQHILKGLEKHDKKFAKQDERFDKHEDRLGGLENWRSYVYGAFAVVVVALGLIAKHVF